MHRIATKALLTVAASATLVLAGCSGGGVTGTYFGTAGDTVLILKPGGKCGYTQEYDEKKGVKVEIDDKCSWSLSGANLTLIGVSSSGSLTAFVGNDGAISIPDQNSWRGEIYSKR